LLRIHLCLILIIFKISFPRFFPRRSFFAITFPASGQEVELALPAVAPNYGWSATSIKGSLMTTKERPADCWKTQRPTFTVNIKQLNFALIEWQQLPSLIHRYIHTHTCIHTTTHTLTPSHKPHAWFHLN